MTITKSGELASFYTVNKALIKHLKVYFSPKQAGEGDPSPENVREIEGWNGLEVYDIGKNLIDKSQARANSVWWNGARQYWPDATVHTVPLVPVKPGLRFFKRYMTTTQGWCSYFDINKKFLYQSNIAAEGTYTVADNVYYIGFSIDKNKLDTAYVSFDIINKTYEPYSGQTYTLNWSNDIDTVYGGYVDLVTGELVQTHINFRVPPNDVRGGTGSFISNTNYQGINHTHRYFYLGNYQIDTSENPISNYLVKGNTSTTAWKYSFDGVQLLHYSLNNETIGVTSETSAADRNTAVVTWLTNNPTYICYKLATPITHQLTPTQLQTLIGRNNIWSNADRVEVEYDLAESNDELYRRRNIILQGAPHLKSVSGNIANFNTDLAAPIKECKISFSPMQEGSGNPSPENVRNISGWNSFNLWHSGKNVFNAALYDGHGYSVSNGIITVPSNDGAGWISRPQIFLKQGTYKISRTSNKGQFRYYIDSEVVLMAQNSSYSSSTLTLSKDAYIRFKIGNQAGDNNYPFTTSIQIEPGNNVTEFEPYNGTTFTIDWISNGTIYGGYVDLINGKLVKTYQYVRIGASNAYTYLGSSNYLGTIGTNQCFKITTATSGGPGAGDPTTCFSNKFSYNKAGTWSKPNEHLWEFCINAGTQLHVVFDNETVGVTNDMDFQARRTVINTWLETNECYFVIPLLTPIEYQLTPQQLKTLKGVNNIWSNANGPISIQYWTH